jgi:phage shock protein E
MKMTLQVGLAIASVLLFAFLFFLRRGDVDGAAARQLVERGALLVDVRTPGEFASGHIAGAINIPVQELDGRLAELGSKSRPVVLYCRSGARSAQAVRVITSAGYQAHNLGAMGRW